MSQPHRKQADKLKLNYCRSNQNQHRTSPAFQKLGLRDSIRRPNIQDFDDVFFKFKNINYKVNGIKKWHPVLPVVNTKLKCDKNNIYVQLRQHFTCIRTFCEY